MRDDALTEVIRLRAEAEQRSEWNRQQSIEVVRLHRLAERLAAALVLRGVEPDDCDALNEWLTS